MSLDQKVLLEGQAGYSEQPSERTPEWLGNRRPDGADCLHTTGLTAALPHCFTYYRNLRRLPYGSVGEASTYEYAALMAAIACGFFTK